MPKSEGHESHDVSRENSTEIQKIENVIQEVPDTSIREQFSPADIEEWDTQLNTFSKKIAEQSSIPRSLQQIQDILPQVTAAIREKRQILIASLKHAPEKQDAFRIALREFTFGIQGPSEQEKKSVLTTSFLEYAGNKLREMAEMMFETTLEKLAEKTQETKKSDEPLSPALDVSTTQGLHLVISKKVPLMKRLSQRVKETWFFLKESIREFIQKLKAERQRTKDPETYQQRLWENMLQEMSVSQPPAGGDDRRDPFNQAPVVIDHWTSTDGTVPPLNCYTSVGHFDRYDSAVDRLVKADAPHAVSPIQFPATRTRSQSVDTQSSGMRTVENFEKRYPKYTMVLHHFDPRPLAKNDGLAPLPRAYPMGETLLLPLVAEIKFAHDEIVSICSLWHDENGSLYVDTKSLPPTGKITEFSIKYSIHDPKDSPAMSPDQFAFIEENPILLNGEKTAMCIDPAAVAAEISVPAELKEQMERWKKLPVSERVNAVKTYLRKTYGYGRGSEAMWRIRRQPGVSDLEKIMHAHEGNCFDVNRVGYVLLHKLGIPCTFHTGYGESREEELVEEVGHTLQPISEADTVGKTTALAQEKRSIHLEKIHSSESHAFLRYVDPETGTPRVLDLTPPHQRDFVIAKQQWLERRQLLDAKYAFAPFKEWKEEADRNFLQIIESMKSPWMFLSEPWMRDGRIETTWSTQLSFPDFSTDLCLGRVVDMWKPGRRDVDYPSMSDVTLTWLRGRHQERMYVQLRQGWEDIVDTFTKIFTEYQQAVEKIIDPIRREVDAYIERIPTKRRQQLVQELQAKFELPKERLPDTQSRAALLLLRFVVENAYIIFPEFRLLDHIDYDFKRKKFLMTRLPPPKQRKNRMDFPTAQVSSEECIALHHMLIQEFEKRSQYSVEKIISGLQTLTPKDSLELIEFKCDEHKIGINFEDWQDYKRQHGEVVLPTTGILLDTIGQKRDGRIDDTGGEKTLVIEDPATKKRYRVTSVTKADEPTVKALLENDPSRSEIILENINEEQNTIDVATRYGKKTVPLPIIEKDVDPSDEQDANDTRRIKRKRP